MAGALNELSSIVSAQVDASKDTVEECKMYLQLSLDWTALHLLVWIPLPTGGIASAKCL